jgi:predicted ATP-grasp superfamily ATP-dependent carboligase
MDNSNSPRVLVFGDDMRIFLTISRALGRSGKRVHAVPFAANAPALKSRYIHQVHLVPDYALKPDEWRKAVSALLSQYEFDLIIPCTDPSIIAIDAQRDIFEGKNIAIPQRNMWDVFFDKQMTHELCAELDIPVSPAKTLDDNDTARSLVERFGLPLVIKPRRSYWSDTLDVRDKVEIIGDENHLNTVLNKLADKKRFLAEAYFDGAGTGISLVASKGEILQAFQHRRLREGKGGCSSYRISEDLHPQMLEACRKIIARTNYDGVCMFELRHDQTSGNWILLEINSRFWGSMPLPISLGIDFPNLLYDLIVLGKKHDKINYKVGMRSRNLVLDGMNLVKRLGDINVKSIPNWLYDTTVFSLQPVSWLLGLEKSDSFVFDDLGPAFAELARLPKDAVLKVRG